MEYPLETSSFFLNGDHKRVILLLHGFTGSPFYFRPFAQALHKRGWSVFAKQIAGHGTSPECLEETTFHDWRQSAEDAFHRLRNQFEEIFVIGHSLGGGLAIDLAARHPHRCRGFVVIGAPLFIRRRHWHRLMLPLLQRVKKYHPKRSPLLKQTPLAPGSYDRTPLRSLKELYAFINLVLRPSLGKVNDPIRILQSPDDERIEPQSGTVIANLIVSSDKKLILLPSMPHNPFLEESHWSGVLEMTLHFFEEVASPILAPTSNFWYDKGALELCRKPTQRFF